MSVRSSVGELNWLLDGLVERTAGANRAVVLSADGLLLGRSGNMSQPDAEHLSAMASAFQSLAKGTGRHFGGGEVRQTVVEMETGFLLVMSISDGSSLAVLASRACDIGQVGYEMALLVDRVGQVLTPALRSELHAALPR